MFLVGAGILLLIGVAIIWAVASLRGENLPCDYDEGDGWDDDCDCESCRRGDRDW